MSAERGRDDLQEVADVFDAEIVEYDDKSMSAEVERILMCPDAVLWSCYLSCRHLACLVVVHDDALLSCMP